MVTKIELIHEYAATRTYCVRCGSDWPCVAVEVRDA